MELESFSDKTAENPGNYAYKATTKWKGFVESETGETYLKTDGSGYVTWVENADPVAFAKAALAYAKDPTNSIVAEKSANAPDATEGSTTSTVTFEGLSLGYYLVDSSVGALCSLDTTAKEVEIQEKNGVPSVEKKVQEDSDDHWDKDNTADIGQTVNFQTTITAQAGAQNYVLHDKMDNFWNSKHQTQAVADYSKQIEKMDDQEKEQALAAAEEYNQTLITNGGRFTPSEEEDTLYDSLLDANGTGMMGYITIPEIRCKLPIYHGVEDSVLQVGIGHIEGSSLPVGGKGTHCVLSGHRGLPSAKLFTDLDKLEKGDIFLLHIYDKVLTYEIDQISIVEPEDYGLLEIEDGKDLCTLLTCTPYGINTQRLLVRGHRIENRSGDDSRVTSDAAEVSSLTVAVCVAIPLLIISFLVVDLSIRRSRKKQKK